MNCLFFIIVHRRNVTPASFDGEGDRATPRRHTHYRQFEMPLGAMPEKEGIIGYTTIRIFVLSDLSKKTYYLIIHIDISWSQKCMYSASAVSSVYMAY